MDQRLHFLTLATPDLDAARRFYRDGLGWTPLYHEPGEILFFQIAPGLVLGLFDAESFDRDLLRDRSTSGVSGVTLSHNVPEREDVATTLAALESAGGTIIKPAQEGAFGGVLQVRAGSTRARLRRTSRISEGWGLAARGARARILIGRPTDRSPHARVFLRASLSPVRQSVPRSYRGG